MSLFWRRFVLGLTLSALSLLPADSSAQQGTVTLQTKGPPPVTSFVVKYDCSKLQISTASVGQPPNVLSFTPKFRRYTRECTPNRPAARNEWCTQEVWRVTADYTWTSALQPGKVNQEKDIDSGEVACDCDCAQVGARICVTGKDVSSSGLQGTSGSYHTDYTVEFKATKSGAVWKTWTQDVRVEGSRSWYGYSFTKCFDVGDTDDFCRQLAAQQVIAPGCKVAAPSP